MSGLQICLFGKFDVRYGAQGLGGFEATRVQELFSYLLLHRDRFHSREMLASLLWGDQCTTAQSKKYLRKTLWQLQRALGASPGVAASGLLVAEPEWIQLSTISGLQLDVAEFEAAYAAVRGMPAAEIDPRRIETVEAAARNYAGFLLDGWYQDWCLCERERLHQIYLIMLDKLAAYCEVRGFHEQGLLYGSQILRFDPARERTHRQLMRLYILAGDRTGALHQYLRCEAALRDEFDVAPAPATVALYEQLRRGDPLPEGGDEAPAPPETLVESLRQVQARLGTLQQHVQRALDAATRTSPLPL